MRRIGAAMVGMVALAACSGTNRSVRMIDAVVCENPAQVLFLSGAEQRAVAVELTPEQLATIDGPTELAFADLDAELVSGDNLRGYRCTNETGSTRVDDTEPIERGTLTITIDDTGVDLALRDVGTETATVDDAEFSDLFLAPNPG